MCKRSQSTYQRPTNANETDHSRTLRVQLLIKAVKAVNATFCLCAGGAKFEPDSAVDNTLVQLREALDTNVLERVLYTSHEVGNELGDGATVLDRARDTLCNKHAITLGEVACSAGIAGLCICAASSCLLVLHGGNTAHTTVSLDDLAVTADKVLSRGLGGTGKETTHHDRGCAHGKTLDNVTNILDATIGNARHAETTGKGGDIEDRGSLGPSDSHDFLSDAGTATAHTDTETVGTSSNKSSSLVSGDDVSANHVELRVCLLDELDHVNLVHAVTLAAVQDDNVETCIHEFLQAVLVLWSRANGCRGDELLGVGELRCERVVQVLHKIGTGQKRNQVEVLVNDRKLALLGLVQDAVGFLQVDAMAGGNEVRGHDGSDGVVQLLVELDVAGCNDADQL
jgi:hypothetical protein